ncbi:MAG TPA: hypothetical protein RMI62_21800, partial [Polyangiaceae bacterium LLY-WYZ-15_(1-7)]|nr:hypothetical protein [Polyangiaceae bacterium LLY-WYZ-15_(1-7)]
DVPPGGRAAVWFPRLNMNAEVWVNGRWVGTGGGFERPVAQNWNRPLLFPFPAELLREGGPIDVRLFAYRGDWGGLDPIHVGPHAALAPAHASRHALQIDVARFASAVALLLTLLFFALFLAADRRPLYGYAALAALFYFVHSLAAHLREIVVPYVFGRWLIHATFDAFAVCMIFGFHRLFAIRAPRLERVLLAYLACGATATALAGPDRFLDVALVFHALAGLLPLYAVARLLGRYRQLPRTPRRVILASTLATLLVSAHALAIQAGLLPQSAPRLLHLLAPVLFLAFGTILLSDFLRAYREARALNRELDARVQEKEAELAQSYEALRRLQDQRVLAAERERLMREMHDGLGGRLVSALSLASRGEAPGALSSALREALFEMRVVIDSLDPENDDLVAALATLRGRLQPALQAEGLRVRWAVEDLPRAPELGPSQLLHVLRVVQEAVTNVIKHADASEIRFETGTGDAPDGREAVFVRVADDGAGFGERAGGGHGVANMERRAEELGGQLAIESDADGTRVTLWIPLDVPRSSLAPDEAATR